jgi:hypothetical protein
LHQDDRVVVVQFHGLELPLGKRDVQDGSATPATDLARIALVGIAQLEEVSAGETG